MGDPGEELRRLLGIGPTKTEKRFVAKMTDEEQARFIDLTDRYAKMEEEFNAARGKIMADRNCFWAEINEKYKLHGKNVHWRRGDQSLYEEVEVEDEDTQITNGKKDTPPTLH